MLGLKAGSVVLETLEHRVVEFFLLFLFYMPLRGDNKCFGFFSFLDPCWGTMFWDRFIYIWCPKNAHASIDG